MSADPVRARWETFLAKVEARLTEIDAEASAGLAELVATEVMDPGPLTNALSELKARMDALVRKVDDAWEKTISPELDRAEAGERVETDLRRLGAALKAKIADAYEALEVSASANAARALFKLVDQELQQPHGGRKCSSCGAPLAPKVLHQPSNVTCAHCKAVNTVRPGLATAMYYQGGALHALAREAAQEEGRALARAEATFKVFSHRTQDDASTYRAALTAYWTAYCRAKGAQTPGWSKAQLESDAQVKVSQVWTWVEREAAEMQRHGIALALAAKGDAAGLKAFLAGEGRKHRLGIDEVLELCCEHAQAKAFDTALAVAFELEAPSEPRAEWLAEKRRGVEVTIARRRGSS